MKETVYRKRAVCMLVISLAGILLFFTLLELILRNEARRDQDEINSRFFASTISSLDSNSEEIDSLTENFHSNNSIMLRNLTKAYSDDNYRKFGSMPLDAQSELLTNATQSMEDCEILYIVNRQGDIKISAGPSDNSGNVITDGLISLTQSQFVDLCDGKLDHLEVSNPFYSEDSDTGFLLYLYCGMIPGSYATDGSKYILLGFSSDILDKAINRMSVYSWLDSSVIGDSSYVLMADDSTDIVTVRGVTGYREEIYAHGSDLGVDDDILTDGFRGVKKINGVKCYVSSRAYNSRLYGDNKYLITCVPVRELYRGNFPVIIWNLCLLFVFIVLTTAYSSFVRSELLRSGEEQLRIRLFTLKGNAVYYSRALGKKIIPVITASAVIILLLSLYIQALMKLSDAFSESVAMEEEISNDIEESVSLQNDFLDYYDMQSASRAKLMAFIVALHGDEYFDYGKESDGVISLGNSDGSGNRDIIKDEYRNEVRVIKNSKALNKLREANYVKNIYLISDAGYTMATSSDYWSFSLSTDPEAQSNEFWDILDGKRDTIVQDPMISDEGKLAQFIGCPFNYFTRLDAEGNTEYVKYTDYLMQSQGNYSGNPITRHRGLLQIETDTDMENDIIESAKPSYILANSQISNGGFLIGFIYDYEEDDYYVFYSAVESMIDKTAKELGISENAFSGNYNGFQMINGRRYLQSFRPAGMYYIATAMPTDTLYYNSFITAVFCAGFGLGMMLILSLFTLFLRDMDEEELRREESDPLAVFGHWERSRSWKKSTSTQKFEILIKKALLLGVAVFLAAIAYEAYHFGSNSAIVYILSGGWDRGVHIFSLSAVFVIIVITGLIIKVSEHIVSLVAEVFGKRVSTMMHMITALIKCVAVIVVAFYCLYIMGINATRLLASASVLSIVVGIGAQSLVGDLLAGIFIVMEGSLHVGDYVLINDIRGKVLEIGLRVTKYEDINQNIQIICNNELKSFANMSMKYSVVYYRIPVPYEEDYQGIRKLLNRDFLQLYENNTFLKGIPACLGIDNFGESSVDLCVRFMCEECDRYDVQRFMYDNIMRIFMENDITVPFNQIDVHVENLIAPEGVV